MMMSITEEMKKVLLAGIGAVATTAEKANGLIDEFVKKGELTVEQGKVLNEELKHDLSEKIKDHVNITVVKETAAEPDAKSILSALDKLTPEEREALKKKLAEMENQHDAGDKEST